MRQVLRRGRRNPNIGQQPQGQMQQQTQPPQQVQSRQPYPQTGYPGAPEYPQGGQQAQAQNYPPQGYPQQQPNYPPQQPQQGRRGYPQQNPQAYYGSQRAGDQVTVPPGAMLRIRINEGLSSNRTVPGTSFDGIVVNDVVADGAIAIPRGATVQGTVVDARKGGALKGEGELTLQLTNVVLGGKSYPIASDVWSRESGDKTVHTVNSAIGMGALGAIIGGVAGGGAGAAIGAAAGGGVGVASSAASPRGQVMIPPEAILVFHTTAPSTVLTVSQAEMDRLGQGVPAGGGQQQLVRRPPPGYYGRPYPLLPIFTKIAHSSFVQPPAGDLPPAFCFVLRRIAPADLYWFPALQPICALRDTGHFVQIPGIRSRCLPGRPDASIEGRQPDI